MVVHHDDLKQCVIPVSKGVLYHPVPEFRERERDSERETQRERLRERDSERETQRERLRDSERERERDRER